MLSGPEIKREGIVSAGAVDEGYRATSYDVHISLIIADSKEPIANYTMPPQGIAQVISKERIRVPTNMTGFATVKTSLCNEGLLALNIGILDPGYEGLISSFLVNFSNQPRLLLNGEAFLRLQFVRMKDHCQSSKAVSDKEYIGARRKQSLKFGDTFLNLAEISARAADATLARWFKSILAGVGGAALALGILTFLMNFGSLVLVKTWLQPSDTTKAQILEDELDTKLNQLNNTNQSLEHRLDDMNNRLLALSKVSKTK